MSLLPKNIMGALQWSFSVGAKFARVVPVYTLAVVVASLVSQGALLLAFILPLKVIIILGSTDIPSYFPQSWQAVSRDRLVAFLTAGAAGFYVLHLLSEKVVSFCGKQGAKRLLERSRKIVLFANQHTIATQSYIHYSRVIAGAVFSFIVLVFVGVYYNSLLIFLASCLVFLFALLFIGFRWSEAFKNALIQNVAVSSNTIAALGFLSTFVFIVFDFMLGDSPSVIVAIVSLLLVRQLMSQLARMVADITNLFARRLQVNALFFHGQVFAEKLSDQDQEFWCLLEPSRRNKWLLEVLNGALGNNLFRVESVWHQTGVADVVAFEVEAYGKNGQKINSFLVKLFNSNRVSLALHEAGLLGECKSAGVPSLPFLGVNNIGAYHCHVYLWSGEKKASLIDFKSKRLAVLEKLLYYVPDDDLIERYSRSKHSLVQRLNVGMVGRLRLATTNPEKLKQLGTFEKKFDWVLSRISVLPVQIVNPDILPDTLLCAVDGEVSITHWGKWGIEPLGSSWPTDELAFKRLDQALSQARGRCKRLLTVSESDVKLAALMFLFEYHYLRQQFIAALDLIPALLENIDACEVENGG